MDLIFQKLLSDAGILLTEFWDALWRYGGAGHQDDSPPSPGEPGSGKSTPPPF